MLNFCFVSYNLIEMYSGNCPYLLWSSCLNQAVILMRIIFKHYSLIKGGMWLQLIALNTSPNLAAPFDMYSGSWFKHFNLIEMYSGNCPYLLWSSCLNQAVILMRIIFKHYSLIKGGMWLQLIALNTSPNLAAPFDMYSGSWFKHFNLIEMYSGNCPYLLWSSCCNPAVILTRIII